MGDLPPPPHDPEDTLDRQTGLPATAPSGQTDGSSEPNTDSSPNSNVVDHPTDQQIVNESIEPPKHQQIVCVSGSEDGGFRGLGFFVPVQLTQKKKLTGSDIPQKNNAVRNPAETTPSNPQTPPTQKRYPARTHYSKNGYRRKVSPASSIQKRIRR